MKNKRNYAFAYWLTTLLIVIISAAVIVTTVNQRISKQMVINNKEHKAYHNLLIENHQLKDYIENYDSDQLYKPQPVIINCARVDSIIYVVTKN
jgi:cell division protein FtsB